MTNYYHIKPIVWNMSILQKICDIVIFRVCPFNFFSFFFFLTANGLTATHSNSRRFHEPAKSVYLSLFTQYYFGTSSSANPTQCKSLYSNRLNQSKWYFHRGTLLSGIFRLQRNLVESVLLHCLLGCSKIFSIILSN